MVALANSWLIINVGVPGTNLARARRVGIRPLGMLQADLLVTGQPRA
jgi:hypothetical protein